VKSVHLPARPYLSPPVERAQARIDEAGVRAFQRVVYG